ncbi:MAG: hypothetical protein ABSE97_03185 [Verrucomicrobiota bacterium]|jgi:hypothetical protein
MRQFNKLKIILRVGRHAIGQPSVSEVVYRYGHYGLASRKYKLPIGGVMVTLLVRLLLQMH